MSVAENLYAAHDTMKERGFCKFAQEDRQGRVCAVGALSMAMADGPCRVLWSVGPLPKHMVDDGYCDVGEEHRVLVKVARELFPDRLHYDSIVAFNNHPNTTEDDMLTVFWKAAVRAEEAGL